MSSLLSDTVLVATAGLVALPLVSRRFRRALRPNEHVRLNTTTMVAGLALPEAALLVCAVPVMAGIWTSGSFDRHFFPGDTVIGWVSASLAILLAGSVTFGAVQLRRTEARLRIESRIGLHEQRDGYDLVVLELEQPLAYAVAVRPAGRDHVRLGRPTVRRRTRRGRGRPDPRAERVADNQATVVDPRRAVRGCRWHGRLVGGDPGRPLDLTR